MSQISVKGKIQRSTMGTGAWTLAGDDGKTYELKGAPKDLLKSGANATVEGVIRDDVMSIAMVGPVLEVKSMKVAD